MAINETSVDGKKYRQKTATGWKWYSFITKAKDILFGDGDDANNNLETNLGSFKGITTSTNVTETGYAADATVVSDLNRSLGGLSFGYNETEQKYGYYVTDSEGADTFIPFSDIESQLRTQTFSFNYNDPSTGQANWYTASQNFTTSFEHRALGVVSGSVSISQKSNAGFVGGYITGTNSARGTVHYARNAPASGTCTFTVIGY